MDPSTLLAALRGRCLMFVLVLLVAVSIGAVLCLTLPRSYRATATLLVSGPLSGNTLPDRAAHMQTLADMLTSENVARRVVRILALADSSEAEAAYTRAQPNGSFADWLVMTWLATPKVELGQGSVVRIKVDAPSAAAAAATANAYAQAYFELAGELEASSTSHTEATLDAHLATLRRDLDQAQAQLVDYQRRHGIVSADVSADVVDARLADLAAQLSRAREQNLEQTSRQQQLRQWRDKAGPLDQLREVQSDGQVQRLTTELQQGEARLQELSGQFGAAHPSYQQQLADNERRRTALQSQITKLLAGLDHAAEQARWRMAELEQQMAAQRARLMAGKPVRSELSTLAARVDSAQRTYDMAVQRFVIDMVANQVFHASVSLLSPASVPLEPRVPRLGAVLIGAVAAGVVLGLVLIGLLEKLDRRVRMVTDLQLLPLDQAVPLLGVTSRWNPPRRLVAERRAALPTLTQQVRPA